ncbi:hypothetical protein BN191_380006 [Clostridioides difficile T61]|nr:hypothetical protein BN169_500038 [Clostridioides difficile E16]CCL94519.1 hypothetical protein BN191_380006 [Clostridioides difficile T61]
MPRCSSPTRKAARPAFPCGRHIPPVFPDGAGGPRWQLCTRQTPVCPNGGASRALDFPLCGLPGLSTRRPRR